jgi:hypothetical protein
MQLEILKERFVNIDAINISGRILVGSSAVAISRWSFHR